jgi:hypothetical protein
MPFVGGEHVLATMILYLRPSHCLPTRHDYYIFWNVQQLVSPSRTTKLSVNIDNAFVGMDVITTFILTHRTQLKFVKSLLTHVFHWFRLVAIVVRGLTYCEVTRWWGVKRNNKVVSSLDGPYTTCVAANENEKQNVDVPCMACVGGE